MLHRLPSLFRIIALTACSFLAASTNSWGASLKPEPRCEQLASRTISFTDAKAKDVLEITASGIDCAKAVVTISIRRQDGLPVAAFATPLAWLNEPLTQSGKTTPEALDTFLHVYVSDAQLDIGASTLPQWKRSEQTPGFEQGLELTSPLDRKTYARLRKAKPNMLCLQNARETSVCYVWDTESNRAEIVLQH
ncbi:MAG: hypothetical protein ABL973_04125 [Micropepsaceae bacterium]